MIRFDERITLEVLRRRLAGTVGDALKTDAELAAEVRGELVAAAELQGRARALARAASPTPTAAAPTVAPSVQPMVQRALVAELIGEWPTIRADLSEASRNGLKQAHDGKRWDLHKVRAWGTEHGRLSKASPSKAADWTGPVVKHRLR